MKRALSWATMVAAVWVMTTNCEGVGATAVLPGVPFVLQRTTQADLRQLLGEDYAGARLVVERDSALHVLHLAAGRMVRVWPVGPADSMAGLSRAYWAPDGREIAASVDGAAMIVDAATGSGRPLLPGKEVHEPQFWVDPDTGERCIVYKDVEGEYLWPEDHQIGATWRYRPGAGSVEKLADFPCDSGLSRDGRFLFDTVGHAIMRDLATGRTHVLNGYDLACNGSSSPDNSHRVMHLIWPHSHFGIRNHYDRLVWAIEKPAWADEWDNPRWSNHPDLCTAVLKRGSQRLIVLIRISTQRMVVLQPLDGEWYTPQLWVPSGDAAAKEPYSPIRYLALKDLAAFKHKIAAADSYEPILRELAAIDHPEARLIEEALDTWGRQMLTDAANRPPYDAVVMCREVIARFGSEHALGRAAKRELRQPRRRSQDRLNNQMQALLEAAGSIPPPDGEADPFGENAYSRRYRMVLDTIRKLSVRIQQASPDDEMAARASMVGERFGIVDEHCDVFMPGPVIVEATVQQVSRMPTVREIAPYRSAVLYVRYGVDRLVDGEYQPESIIVAHWAIRDGQPTDADKIKPGQKVLLTCSPLEGHDELRGIPRSQDADDPALDPFMVESVEPILDAPNE